MTSTIQSIPVDPTPPASGEGLIFNGTVYVPTPANPGDITAVNTTLPLTGGGVSGALTLDINNFTGDSGLGGLDGAVPAPAAGDAAAGMFLSAGGTWAVPASGGVTVLANLTNNNSVGIANGTPTLVTGMTATVACTAGKSQEVVFDSDAFLDYNGAPAGSELIWFFLYIDGVQTAGKHERNYGSTAGEFDERGLHLSYLATGLAAGNHTFEIRANSANGSKTVYINTASDATTPIRMYIKEF